MSATKNINAEKIQGNLEVTSISGGTIFSGGTLLQTIIENIVSENAVTGTTGSVAFFGTGNTITQDNTFVWNNTDKRLILGTEAVADTNSRLVVIGKGTGTNTTFAVHNSTGTNNALVVRDDSAVFLSASDYETTNNFQGGAGFRVGNLINFSLAGGLVIGASNTNAQGILNHNSVTVVGHNNTYRFLVNSSAVCVGRGNTVWAGNGTVIGHNNSTGGGLGAATNAVLIGVSNSIATNANAIGIGSNIGASSAQGIFIGSSINNVNLTNNNNHIIGNFFNVTSSSQLNRAIVMGQGVSDASRAVPNINESFSLYFQDLQRSFFVNKNSNIVLRSLQALVAGTQYDTNATNTLTLHNGTAPATNIADAFQQYSADIVAGNAAPHFRTENGSIIKLYQQPAVTTSQGIADALTNAGLLATGSTLSQIQIYKTINSSLSLDDTYHNAIVRVKTTATITVPDGLRSDFNCVFRTYDNVTATFTVSGTATIDSTNSDGLILAEKSNASLFNDGLDNYILAGELS